MKPVKKFRCCFALFLLYCFYSLPSAGGVVLQVVGLSDLGRERSRNEDSFLVRTGSAFSLLAVADGMGGHVAGDVASTLAVSVLERCWDGLHQENPLPHNQISAIVKNMIAEANQSILNYSAGDAAKQGMGTTLTMGLISGLNLVIGHVGDSRAYLIEEGRIKLLTEDHSLLEQLIQQGSVSPEEVQGHPQRHILTRALGTASDVEIDLVETELKEGSALILCTDGLTTLLQDDEILDIIYARQDDPGLAVRSLINLANKRGGYDNITVVLATGIGRHAG
jgi:PPM family protein phosphatase